MTRPATKKQNSPGSSKGTQTATKAGPSAAGEPFPPPLKPRRTMFFLLLLAFLAWVGLLLGLYFKTVYPMRHPKSEPPALAALRG